MQRRHVFLVIVPIGISLFDENFAFFKDALHQDFDIKTLVGIPGSESDVVEIDKQGNVGITILLHKSLLAVQDRKLLWHSVAAKRNLKMWPEKSPGI